EQPGKGDGVALEPVRPVERQQVHSAAAALGGEATGELLDEAGHGGFGSLSGRVLGHQRPQPRQADLARLRALVAEYATAEGAEATVPGFVEELSRRFAAERSGRGVNLLTFHRANGLECDAVSLPRLL